MVAILSQPQCINKGPHVISQQYIDSQKLYLEIITIMQIDTGIITV